MRALSRDGDAREALQQALAEAAGTDARFDAAVRTLAAELDTQPADAASARRVAQLLCLALQASLLIRHAPPVVADGFCASRLAGDRFAGAAFGTLPRDVDSAAIVARAADPSLRSG